MWEYDNGEKVQRQDYFSQQSCIIFTLAAYTSATDQQRTYVGWYCEKYALLTEIFNPFSPSHCHSYIAVHFLEMFLSFVITCKRQLTKKMLRQLGSASCFNTSFTFPTSPLLLPAYSDMFCGEHNTTFTHHTH